MNNELNQVIKIENSLMQFTDGIFKDKKIRITNNYVSVFDIIQVAGGQKKDASKKIWEKILKNYKEEVTSFLSRLKYQTHYLKNEFIIIIIFNMNTIDHIKDKLRFSEDKNYVSVFDIIQVVGCQKYPRKIWETIMKKGCNFEICYLKFPGAGQRNTPCILIDDISQLLISFLPGCRISRHQKENIFHRF